MGEVGRLQNAYYFRIIHNYSFPSRRYRPFGASDGKGIVHCGGLAR